MKNRMITSLVLLTFGLSISTAQVPSDPSKFYIYLFMGQSNMSGMAPAVAEDLVAKPRVYKFTSNGTWVAGSEVISAYGWAAGNFAAIGKQCVGPAKTIGEAIASMRPDISVGLVGAAVSASAIEEWQRGAANYGFAVNTLRKAMKSGTVKGAFWHQGEANGGTSNYDVLMTNVINNLRQDVGVPDLPFIMGQVGTSGDANWGVNAALEKVKKAVPKTAVSSSAGLSLADNVHYDNRSQKLMGTRMAEAYRPFLGPTQLASSSIRRVGASSFGECQVFSLDGRPLLKQSATHVSREAVGGVRVFVPGHGRALMQAYVR